MSVTLSVLKAVSTCGRGTQAVDSKFYAHTQKRNAANPSSWTVLHSWHKLLHRSLYWWSVVQFCQHALLPASIIAVPSLVSNTWCGLAETCASQNLCIPSAWQVHLFCLKWLPGNRSHGVQPTWMAENQPGTEWAISCWIAAEKQPGTEWAISCWIAAELAHCFLAYAAVPSPHYNVALYTAEMSPSPTPRRRAFLNNWNPTTDINVLLNRLYYSTDYSS